MPHPHDHPSETYRARAAVDRALAELPDGHRQVLLLTRSGLGYREIAERWGIPVERVRATALHAVLALTRARLAATVTRADGATAAG
jgi:DNA-directed RNA polymerase specialized sigma24 family protein